jgi:biopolymer transport protein ExbD
MKLPIKKESVRRTDFTIRMTPLIDVIFLLMIFFILTIRFHDPEGVLETKLPERGERIFPAQQKDWEVVRLKLIREGEELVMYLQERVVYTYTDLLSYLNLLPQQIMLVIEPESKVPYKHVIEVYNTCLKSKKSNIVFSIPPR